MTTSTTDLWGYPAEIVIAHNAKFDRAFYERLDDGFRHKAWACSVAEVAWTVISDTSCRNRNPAPI